VIGAARGYLEALEAERDGRRAAANGAGGRQAELPLTAASPPDALREALSGLDPDELSPKDALAALYRLRQLLDAHRR
jgi:DNA mismatch repair protein MutS